MHRPRVRHAPAIAERRRLRLSPAAAGGGASSPAVGLRSAARAVAAEFGERIALPDQAREFGQRIVAGAGDSAVRVARGVVRTIGSLDCCRPPFGPRFVRSPATRSAGATQHVGRDKIYRISSGASTPSSASPEARTVTTPCTKASRAAVISGSFWIMKRK